MGAMCEKNLHKFEHALKFKKKSHDKIIRIHSKKLIKLDIKQNQFNKKWTENLIEKKLKN
jgi:hypothetical protein